MVTAKEDVTAKKNQSVDTEFTQLPVESQQALCPVHHKVNSVKSMWKLLFENHCDQSLYTWNNTLQPPLKHKYRSIVLMFVQNVPLVVCGT